MDIPNSVILCTGIWFDCSTVNDHQKCKISFPKEPHITVRCHMKNVCVKDRHTILFNPYHSPIIDAFNSFKLSVDGLTEYQSLGGKLQIEVLERASAAFSHFDPMPTVFISGMQQHNIGHVWGDSIWPAFQILHIFGAEKADFQFLLNGDPVPQLNSQLYEAISKRPILYSSGSIQQFKCFKDLYTGIDSSISYMLGKNPNPQALAQFRDFAMQQMNVQKTPSTHEEPSILILLKNAEVAGHKSCILNIAEITASLEEEFLNVDITHASWYGMPLEKQFQVMHNADIVLTLPGSDVMNVLFMKPGSTVLVYCRYVAYVEMSHEVMNWMQAVPEMRSFQVCGKNDLHFEGQGVIIDISNLKKYMNMAILDWKERKFGPQASSYVPQIQPFKGNDRVFENSFHNLTAWYEDNYGTRITPPTCTRQLDVMPYAAPALIVLVSLFVGSFMCKRGASKNTEVQL